VLKRGLLSQKLVEPRIRRALKLLYLYINIHPTSSSFPPCPSFLSRCHKKHNKQPSISIIGYTRSVGFRCPISLPCDLAPLHSSHASLLLRGTLSSRRARSHGRWGQLDGRAFIVRRRHHDSRFRITMCRLRGGGFRQCRVVWEFLDTGSRINRNIRALLLQSDFATAFMAIPTYEEES